MNDPHPPWATRYPDRWRRELDELHASRWPHRITTRVNTVVIEIDWPMPTGEPSRVPEATEQPGLIQQSTPESPRSTQEPTHDQGPGHRQGKCRDPRRDRSARLEVWFPPEYPFFPPRVFDRDNQLELGRHRTPDGVLCLVEETDWHPDTTIAALLTRQLPNLVAAGRSTIRPAEGLEVPAPEPVGGLVSHISGQQALIMPTHPIPARIDQGAVIIRYTLNRGRVIGAGLAERILGDGLDIAGPAPELEPVFQIVTFGRWARDPGFDPAHTPEETWQRVTGRLQPLEVEMAEADEDRCGLEVPLDQVETLCLLVPSEDTYRQLGESWVAVRQVTDEDGGTRYDHLPVQCLGPETYATRTPESRTLIDRRVVLVGVGAIGSHIALDLARTGVGHLSLVDGDVVDVATATRQHAPIYAAGRPKAEAMLSQLRLTRPDTDLVGLQLRIGDSSDFEVVERKRRTFARLLRSADLVIDATANPAVTRYLAAVRHVHQLPFLHVSATAGAWGGCVLLTTAQTACWACLQHHRHDHTVPVPTTDPAGPVTPTGCADPTFTGNNPDLALIAHHASQVAIDHLTDGPGLGGNLYVAHLRTPAGGRQPITWQRAQVPVHTDCPLHTNPDDAPRDETRREEGSGDGAMRPSGTDAEDRDDPDNPEVPEDLDDADQAAAGVSGSVAVAAVAGADRIDCAVSGGPNHD
ncbi:HesA/MoeB/ThiF family protein [Nocardioides halotolerans]|uniref:HesA/MoeB/ThiF family protein n=1 Tax=Nocardioides halotolerans TaxID=433660 RepID=UPI0004155B91|nr:ThiF family adenylyltransferase [Nocardioides halotolerans]